MKLDDLPFDILAKVFALSLELNLVNTSQTLRIRLNDGLGCTEFEAFEKCTRWLRLVSLFPPQHWTDELYGHAPKCLGVERSRDAEGHYVLQEKVFNSGWFGITQLRKALHELLSYGLQSMSMMKPSLAATIMDELRIRHSDPMELMDYRCDPGWDAERFEEGLLATYPFSSAADHHDDTHRLLIGVYVVPEKLLRSALTEGDIQLLWFFRAALEWSSRHLPPDLLLQGDRDAERAYSELGADFVLELKANTPLLSRAIELNIASEDENVEAVRELCKVRTLFDRQARASQVQVQYTHTAPVQLQSYSHETYFVAATRANSPVMVHTLCSMYGDEAFFLGGEFMAWVEREAAKRNCDAFVRDLHLCIQIVAASPGADIDVEAYGRLTTPGMWKVKGASEWTLEEWMEGREVRRRTLRRARRSYRRTWHTPV